MPSEIAVTRITHSCHLIEIGGLTFLTDPWFSTRPTYYPGEPIALSVPELPDLDGVLITHEHYDHWTSTLSLTIGTSTYRSSSPTRSSSKPLSTASIMSTH